MAQSQASTPAIQDAAAKFPLEELREHRGCWVAFSPDGCRLLASSPTIAALDNLVRSAGEDLEEVLLQWVPEGDSIASGMELS